MNPKDNQRNRNKTASLSLETIISHPEIKATAEEQACYLILDISPAKALPPSRLPLNLCLVLDKSTSMQGARLQQVKEATRQIIDFIKPDDSLSLVTFSDKAQVVIPSQKNINKSVTKSMVSTIQPSGGTEMLQGLLAGLKELQTNRSTDSVNHLILLTDGQTYGDEDDCLKQATWAGQNHIGLSTMGIGSDWNEDLLDAMAKASGGISSYIDVPQKIVEIFRSTVNELSSIVARKIILTVKPAQTIRVEEAFQITPHIQRIDINDNNQAILGPLGTFNKKTILMELRLTGLTTPGEQTLMNLNVDGDLPALAARQARVSTTIHTLVTDDPSELPIPPNIITALGKLAIYKMQEKVMVDLESGNITAATQRLETMATRLLNLGEADLARAALLEAGRLSRTGDLSAEGRKKIRYGTRSLSMLPKELQ